MGIDDALDTLDVPVPDIPTFKVTKLKIENSLNLVNVFLVATILVISTVLLMACLATRNNCTCKRKVVVEDEEEVSSDICEEFKEKILNRSLYDLYPVSFDI